MIHIILILFIFKFSTYIQFQEGEKRRYKAEQQRQESKHKKQLEELRALSESTVKELEQMQVCHLVVFIVFILSIDYGRLKKKKKYMSILIMLHSLFRMRREKC